MSEEKKQKEANILVCIADGSEDIEAVTMIDVLRRTQNVNLIVATVGGKNLITASRKTNIIGDASLKDAIRNNTTFDMICLPGGMPGAVNLYNDKSLISLISEHLNKPNFILAAICAAPAVVLSQSGLLKGLNATCYPVAKFKDLLKNNGAIFENAPVVIAPTDKSSVVVTSQGPATALEFSFVLVHLLFGFKLANKIANAMLSLYGTKYVDPIKKVQNKSNK